MVTKLVVYNNAVIDANEEMLATLSDETKARRLCDQFFDQVVALLLESGNWKFALRTVSMTPDSSITPEFGFDHVYSKPADWKRTYALSPTGDFDNNPLVGYHDEGSTISAGCDPLFARYVSADASYGADMGRWPQLFTDAVSKTLASKIAPGLTASATLTDRLIGDAKIALRDARSKDAIQGSIRFPPTGKWVRSRGAGRPTDGQVA